MARQFFFTCMEDGHAQPSSFQLRVPSPDVPAADLSACVRDRLGLLPGVPFFVTEEPEVGRPPSDIAVPLCSLLPDGSRLRVVLPNGRRSPMETLERPQPLPVTGEMPGEATLAEASEGRCCRLVSEPVDSKQLSIDLANERTLLAWVRTGLAAIRTVFSFATLSGLTKGELVVDVFVTLVLSCSGLATLLVGWTRFAAVRKGAPGTRRVAIGPLYTAFVLVAAICLLGSLVRQPKRFQLQDPSPLHLAAETAWTLALG
ncbi:unnamed protein product [Symbiodinium pilosum]|uniref:DUF202 domain-containing protein n=1 Tax=Symbiodinium pilosum TaxID=2952 RepID=A0A812IXP0_SYMPI|nr:unnamed protein product [Symbiodinium pilosum]